jgi:hypothetical protein
MRNQKQAVVQNEINWRNCQRHARHSTDDKRHHEADRPKDRDRKADTTGVQREEPIENLHAGRDVR